MRASEWTWFGIATALAMAVACNDAEQPPPGGHGGDGGNEPAGESDEPCAFGDDAAKCGASSEAACFPVVGSAEESCASDADCTEGSLCFLNEEAASDPPGVCRALSGQCDFVGNAGSGLAFGETCTLSEDACSGTCVDVGYDDGTGECEETCRVGAMSGCGEADLSTANVACAFFAYDLSDAGITQGAGDVGVCAQLCRCNSDCPGTQRCLDYPIGDFPGVCAGGIDDGEALEDCTSDALGGAGGDGP